MHWPPMYGLSRQVHLHWNIGPSASNTWSFNPGDLSWQLCHRFHCSDILGYITKDSYIYQYWLNRPFGYCVPVLQWSYHAPLGLTAWEELLPVHCAQQATFAQTWMVPVSPPVWQDSTLCQVMSAFLISYYDIKTREMVKTGSSRHIIHVHENAHGSGIWNTPSLVLPDSYNNLAQSIQSIATYVSHIFFHVIILGTHDIITQFKGV